MKDKNDWDFLDPIFDNIDKEKECEDVRDSKPSDDKDYKNRGENIIDLFEENSDSLNSNDSEESNDSLDLKYTSLEDREKTNQGLGHTKNPAPYLYEKRNFYVRTSREAAFIEAAHRMDLSYSAGQVWCPNEKKKKMRRVEFDLVIKCPETGMMAFIETNGGSHKDENADDRDSRVNFMRDSGYLVRSFPEPNEWEFDTDTEMINWAKQCIEEVLSSLKRSMNIRKLPCWEDYND
jgi:hypothetical protein